MGCGEGLRALFRLPTVSHDLGTAFMNRRTFSALLASTLLLPLSAGSVLASVFGKYDGGSFRKLLASGNPVVVHVHADWCTVCRAQLPVMERVLSEPSYKNVRAIRVNFDSEKQFLTDFKVVRQSTIIVFKGGKEVSRLSYESDPSRIQETLQQAIA